MQALLWIPPLSPIIANLYLSSKQSISDTNSGSDIIFAVRERGKQLLKTFHLNSQHPAIQLTVEEG